MNFGPILRLSDWRVGEITGICPEATMSDLPQEYSVYAKAYSTPAWRFFWPRTMLTSYADASCLCFFLAAVVRPYMLTVRRTRDCCLLPVEWMSASIELRSSDTASLLSVRTNSTHSQLIWSLCYLCLDLLGMKAMNTLAKENETSHILLARWRVPEGKSVIFVCVRSWTVFYLGVECGRQCTSSQATQIATKILIRSLPRYLHIS